MKKSFTDEDVKTNIERLTKCFPKLVTGMGMLYRATDKIADNYNKLTYPEHPNWTYCIPILPNYTNKNGEVYDLGIHIEESWIEKYGPWAGISANFVSSNEGPDYRSGYIRLTSEESKIVLLQLLQWNMIDEVYLMRALCEHNNNLMNFMHSDLTAWDLEDWIAEKTKE
jgi:hypothetical protein